MSSDIIYKYVPFSINSLKLLIKGELWLGFPHNLNDPYEGEFLTNNNYNIPSNMLIEFFYQENPYLLNDEGIESKQAKIKYDYSAFHNDVHTIYKKRLKSFYGVSSFSYVQDSILMWSQYADSHKGFCIAFDKSLLEKTLKYPSPWFDFIDVDYQRELCTAKLIIEKDEISIQNEIEILSRKLDIWKKEFETRIIAKIGEKTQNRNYQFDKKCIKSIIFGENISEDDKNTLNSLIGSDVNYSDLDFYSAKKDLYVRKMVIEKLK